MTAFRYLALNPMKAGLVTRAEDWPWSSVAAHLAGRDTPYVLVEPALSRGADFAGLVAGGEIDPQWSSVLRAELIGRPVGAKAWVEGLEVRYGRQLLPQKRGPKPKGLKGAGQLISCH